MIIIKVSRPQLETRNEYGSLINTGRPTPSDLLATVSDADAKNYYQILFPAVLA